MIVNKYNSLLYLVVIWLLVIAIVSIGFFWTAIVFLLGSSLLVYSACIFKGGRTSRQLLILLFLLSYPLPIIIIGAGYSLKSPPQFWYNNDFIFEDVSATFVLIVSIISYWVLIVLHNLMFLVVKGGHTVNDRKDSLVNYDRHFILPMSSEESKQRNIMSTKKGNYKRYFWASIIFLLLVLYVQNLNGWGIHGLPNHLPNYLKMVGISIYLRDYFIPIFMIFAISRGFKTDAYTGIALLLLLYIASFTSLSKVTIIAYSFVYIYFQYSRYGIGILRFRNIITRLSFPIFFIICVLVFQNEIRNSIILTGEPIVWPLTLANLEALTYLQDPLGIFSSSFFISLIERFLGFTELASVLYYQYDFNTYSNFLYYSGLIDSDQMMYVTSVRDLTGSNIGGGIGVDLISTALLMGWFSVIPIFILSIYFLAQAIIINFIPNRSKIIIEIFLMVIFLRFSLDGNIRIIFVCTLLMFCVIAASTFIRRVKI